MGPKNIQNVALLMWKPMLLGSIPSLRSPIPRCFNKRKLPKEKPRESLGQPWHAINNVASIPDVQRSYATFNDDNHGNCWRTSTWECPRCSLCTGKQVEMVELSWSSTSMQSKTQCATANGAHSRSFMWESSKSESTVAGKKPQPQLGSKKTYLKNTSN